MRGKLAPVPRKLVCHRLGVRLCPRDWAAAAMLVAMAAAGCGGDASDSSATGPSMAPQSSGAESGAGLNVLRRTEVAPQIQRVRFDPALPKKGESVRAVVELVESSMGGAAGETQLDYVWTVGGVRHAGRGPVLKLSRGKKGDGVEVSVTARDGSARSESVSASTRIANSEPVIQSVRMEPASGLVANGSVRAIPAATDPDHDAIAFEYSWRVNGVRIRENGASLSTASLVRGDRVRVSVVASDGEDRSDDFNGSEITLENADPVFVSNPEPAGPDGVFRYRPRSEDPDGDRDFRFSLAQAPEGMKIRFLDGKIEWRPRANQSGRHLVEVVVEDGEGGRASQRFEVVVAPPDPSTEAAPPASP